MDNKGADQSALAGLRLCCSQIPGDSFSRIEAHISILSRIMLKFNTCFQANRADQDQTVLSQAGSDHDLHY